MEELRARLLITAAEIEAWEHLSRRMFVPFHDDGVISQFDGYARSGSSTGSTTAAPTATSSGWT